MTGGGSLSVFVMCRWPGCLKCFGCVELEDERKSRSWGGSYLDGCVGGLNARRISVLGRVPV